MRLALLRLVSTAVQMLGKGRDVIRAAAANSSRWRGHRMLGYPSSGIREVQQTSVDPTDARKGGADLAVVPGLIAARASSRRAFGSLQANLRDGQYLRPMR